MGTQSTPTRVRRQTALLSLIFSESFELLQLPARRDTLMRLLGCRCCGPSGDGPERTHSMRLCTCFCAEVAAAGEVSVIRFVIQEEGVDALRVSSGLTKSKGKLASLSGRARG